MTAPVPSEGRGMPMLLLHGSASHGGMWKELRGHLGRRFDTIAPDLIGYGQGPAWTETGVTLTDEVSHLLPLLGDADKLHIVGYSYGGAVAIALASAVRERVERLVLVEPVAFPALRVTGEDESYATFLRWHEEFSRKLQAGRRSDAMRTFIDLWSGGAVWDGLLESRRQQMESLARKIEWDWRASFSAFLDVHALRQLGRRTVLVCGDRSPAPMVRLVHSLHQLADGGRLVVLPGANHLLPMTHARELAGLLDRAGES